MTFKHSWFCLWRTVGALIVGSVLLAGCASLEQPADRSERLTLTPITASPTNVYHPGKFVWHDLLTPDVAAAMKFYGELFDWSFEQQGRYTVILNKGHQVGGMVEIKSEAGKEAEGLWLASMSVSNVDRATDYIKAQGGIVHKGPLDMEKRGRGVLISDPQGAQLALLHAAGGDPADAEPAIGDWLWNEIWSNVPQATLGFYQALGEYDSSIEGNNYRILKSEGKWRAGIRHVFKEDLKIRWVPAVRVADPEAITDKVENLGGVVWVRPGEPPSDGDIALISDNTGTLLMVQRWSTQSAAGGQ